MAALHRIECFRNGHFAPGAGQKVRERSVTIGSACQQAFNQIERLSLPFKPVALNNLERLAMLFKPIASGVEKCQSFIQIWLATLTIIRPVDLFRGQQ